MPDHMLLASLSGTLRGIAIHWRTGNATIDIPGSATIYTIGAIAVRTAVSGLYRFIFQADSFAYWR
ncbi:hypothetical protein GCM10011502_04160 [Oceanisphaera marina]|uniref:Uncharacterized protein n=1 Tax=Oceanisphaera marina TaxID=2017550 RepID=A0ABQ1IC36_9GAMM|nr:hypothetical protein GCM10011502_04160 [Oceanisphaera marina]